ncbi:MAG TPA: hypothetical protein VFB80_09590 [Pirellulaceae bacterium]|nr:hypothetical protein [Pirellulaceae bacterium]
MNAAPTLWSSDTVCLHADGVGVPAIARAMYERTCRTDFSAPGFCLLNAGSERGSRGLRRLMVDLRQELATLHEARTGQTLNFVSVVRVDQQATTRPHLDGGPEQSLLMLGYEPSAVRSELEISDYSRCAFDLGLTPKEFLGRHNPMFRSGSELLRAYTTRIPCFSPADHQIAFINNSSTPYSADGATWQGVLHTATVPAPDENQRRVINSTMLASVPLGTRESVSTAELDEFLKTTAVRRQGYDKPHLQDDA